MKKQRVTEAGGAQNCLEILNNQQVSELVSSIE